MSRLHKSQNIYWFPMSLNTPEGRGVPIRDTAKNGTFFYVMNDTVRHRTKDIALLAFIKDS